MDREIRAYRIAATDLFVEKAIKALEVDSSSYARRGRFLFCQATAIVLLAIYVSAYSVVGSHPLVRHYFYFLPEIWSVPAVPPDPLSTKKENESMDNGYFDMFGYIKNVMRINIDNSKKEKTQHQLDVESSDRRFDKTIGLVSSITAKLTFYGFLIILSVAQWRYGKALMDQAERMRERRHALRQGRLFVHLHDGKVSIEELEKAFSWNISAGNAFGNIQTEQSPPLTGVIKDAFKAISDIYKGKSQESKP